jgi:hypothetical protein
VLRATPPLRCNNSASARSAPHRKVQINKNKLFLGVRKCLLKDNRTVYRPVCFAIEVAILQNKSHKLLVSGFNFDTTTVGPQGSNRLSSRNRIPVLSCAQSLDALQALYRSLPTQDEARCLRPLPPSVGPVPPNKPYSVSFLPHPLNIVPPPSAPPPPPPGSGSSSSTTTTSSNARSEQVRCAPALGFASGSIKYTPICEHHVAILLADPFASNELAVNQARRSPTKVPFF